MTDLKRVQRWIKEQIKTCEYNIHEFTGDFYKQALTNQIAAYTTVLNKIEEMLNEEE